MRYITRRYTRLWDSCDL